MRHAGVMVIAAAAAFAANAGYYQWYGSADDNDIANKANYNNASSVDWSTLGIGNFGTGTYQMSKDIAIPRIVVNKTGADVTFDLGAERTLTLIGTDNAQSFRATVNGSYSTFRVSSGTVRQVYDPSSYTYGSGDSYAVWQIGENATCGFTNVFTGANTALKAYRLLNAHGTNNWLVVRDGARVDADLMFGIVPGGSRGANNGILLDGGTLKLLSATNNMSGGTFHLGVNSRSRGDTLVFANGGRLLDSAGTDVSKWAVGDNAPDVRLAFRGDGTSHTMSEVLKLGNGATGSGACVEVSDGAHLTLGGPSVGRFWLGCTAGADGASLVVSGAGTRLTGESTSNYIVGQDANNNVFSVKDGAVATLAGYMRICSHANVQSNAVKVSGGGSLSVGYIVQVGFNKHNSNNSIDISGGGIMSVGSSLVIGNDEGANSNRVTVAGVGSSLSVKNGLFVGTNAFATVGNTLAVSNGASVTAKFLYMYGTNAVLDVDNASIATTEDIQLPMHGHDATGVPRIRIAGSNARIAAGTTLRIRKNAALEFDIPETGYLSAPLTTTGRVEIIGNATMSFNIDKFRENGGGECVLAETTGNAALYVEPGTMAGLQESLPERCRLKVVDNKRLVLRVPTNQGLIIFVQ